MDTPASPEAAVYLRAPSEDDREAFVALRRVSADSLRPWEPHMDDAEEQFEYACEECDDNELTIDPAAAEMIEVADAADVKLGVTMFELSQPVNRQAKERFTRTEAEWFSNWSEKCYCCPFNMVSVVTTSA